MSDDVFDYDKGYIKALLKQNQKSFGWLAEMADTSYQSAILIDRRGIHRVQQRLPYKRLILVLDELRKRSNDSSTHVEKDAVFKARLKREHPELWNEVQLEGVA